MMHAPQLMTESGLAYLRGLAGIAGAGVILELGPLFGSATNALAQGRRDDSIAIHSIDPFEPLGWVQQKFGLDLSRGMFDKFTRHIANLHVHQGRAPEVVEANWTEQIGLYFDDCAHANPEWRRNHDFFAPFLSDTAILSGNDYSLNWPMLVANVQKLRQQHGCGLFVIGRVWAMTYRDEARITQLIDRLYPSLAGVTITAHHRAGTETTPAACWTNGHHALTPLQAVSIQSTNGLDGQIMTYVGGRIRDTVGFDGTPIQIEGAEQIYLSTSEPASFQFSTLNDRGRTKNGKALRSGTLYSLPMNESILAMSLSR